MNAAPRNVADVFEDFKNRRNGLVRALTDDVDEFYRQCDPEAENLCLYGFADGSWRVQLPAEEVPPEVPEPALGINFARDGMSRRDWLALVAVHSDAWLMAVAFYYGAGLVQAEREDLFARLNFLPTVFEVHKGDARSNPAQSDKEKNSEANNPSHPPAPAEQGNAPKPQVHTNQNNNGGNEAAQTEDSKPKRPKPTVPHSQTSVEPAQAEQGKQERGAKRSRSRAEELLEDLGKEAIISERSKGKILHPDDDYAKLHEKKVELLWPDDGYWYRAVVESVEPEEKKAHVLYVGGDTEDMDLDEIANEQSMNIIDEQ